MKKLFVLILSIFMFASTFNLSAQETKYYPDGDPKQWNVKLAPFVWLPWINGELKSEYLTESFGIPVVDLLGDLKGAFMINAEVSRGKFFASPTYIYTKLGAEKLIKTNEQGIKSITASSELKMNIVEFIAGMHNPVSVKIIIDPFLGFRYNNFNTSISVDGVLDTTSVSETADFWDPVLGIRALYFPHPRVPIMFKADIGGFGLGSDFSWTSTLNGGYTVSPLIDLTLGFSAYGTNFKEESKTGNSVGLKTIMYGLNTGIKFFIPKRVKDQSVFSKKKKG